MEKQDNAQSKTVGASKTDKPWFASSTSSEEDQSEGETNDSEKGNVDDDESEGSNWYCLGRERHEEDVGAEEDMEIYGDAPALRAMGLAPWVAREDGDGDEYSIERDLVAAANAILFPDTEWEGGSVPDLVMDEEMSWS